MLVSPHSLHAQPRGRTGPCLRGPSRGTLKPRDPASRGRAEPRGDPAELWVPGRNESTDTG